MSYKSSAADDDLYSGFDAGGFGSGDPHSQHSHLSLPPRGGQLGALGGPLGGGGAMGAPGHATLGSLGAIKGKSNFGGGGLGGGGGGGGSLGRAGGITGRNSTGTQQARLMTSQGTVGDQRPMTSNKGAGFRSGAGGKQAHPAFDPLNQNRGPAPPLVDKGDDSSEERAKQMERKVHRLINQSALAAANDDLPAALDIAKQAAKKERALCKFRESNGLVEQINLDLTYSVCFNLAACYHKGKMYSEALNTYGIIVKNKQYPQAGRLRVNMGNIFYEQKKYMNAIKNYRMALDQIPNTSKELRYKIMRNIGNAFVKLGQFHDAIDQYETVVNEAKPEAAGFPDFQTPFNLLVCYYAIGASDKMRKGFSRLLAVPQPKSYDDDSQEDDAGGIEGKSSAAESKMGGGMGGMGAGVGQKGAGAGAGAEAGVGSVGHHKERDALREEVVQRQKQTKSFILTSAKLIAPYIDQREWIAGFDWLIDQLKTDFPHLASEVEIAKAIAYLRRKQFDRAIEVFKSFEKKDASLLAKAATNLSFLYFIEGEYELADKYANLAVKNDRYNAKALVNKGNCLFANGELEKAKELYLESIGVEADCVEAIYNLGIVNKKLGILGESLTAFDKLHTTVPSSPEVIYQIANLHDLSGNYQTACKYFSILLTAVKTDPGILSRLGQTYVKDEDESQAFHYHSESYRHYPVNLEVISWLGVWYVKSEMYEKAIQYFERAAEIQPKEVKWRLMVTSCYRRLGSYQKALELYEEIHKEYPQNLECLRYLVAICKELGMPYDGHELQLRKLERAAAQASAANSGMAGGILTQMNQNVEPPPQQQQQQQQGYGGGRGGGGRGPVSRMAPIQDADEPVSPGTGGSGGGRGGPAPGVSGQLQTRAIKQQRAAAGSDDEFADADIDDLWAD